MFAIISPCAERTRMRLQSDERHTRRLNMNTACVRMYTRVVEWRQYTLRFFEASILRKKIQIMNFTGKNVNVKNLSGANIAIGALRRISLRHFNPRFTYIPLSHVRTQSNNLLSKRRRVGVTHVWRKIRLCARWFASGVQTICFMGYPAKTVETVHGVSKRCECSRARHRMAVSSSGSSRN